MKLVVWLRYIGAIAIFLMFGSVRAEQPDSIACPVLPDTVPTFLVPGGAPQPVDAEISTSSLFEMTPEQPSLTLLKSYDMPSFKIEEKLMPSIFSWRGGYLGGAGQSSSLPGMMGIEDGRLNLYQSIGNVTLSLWGGVTKYGYYRGLQTSWGFGGMLDYKINENWGLTLFGEYYSPTNAATPGMGGYMGIPRFGGYASYNFNDHWGVRVGAQTQRSIFTNRWEMQPIVMPYYRINKNVDIGVDVGSILYYILHDWANSNRGRVNSPVIGPPRQGPPPVAPRR